MTNPVALGSLRAFHKPQTGAANRFGSSASILPLVQLLLGMDKPGAHMGSLNKRGPASFLHDLSQTGSPQSFCIQIHLVRVEWHYGLPLTTAMQQPPLGQTQLLGQLSTPARALWPRFTKLKMALVAGSRPKFLKLSVVSH